MKRRLKFEIVNYLTEESKTNELYIDDISDIINEKHDIQTQDVTVEKTIDNIAEVLINLDSNEIYNLHYERIYFFIHREDNMDGMKEEYANTDIFVPCMENVVTLKDLELIIKNLKDTKF